MAAWSSADCGMQSLLVEAFGTLQAIRYASLVYREDSVADEGELGKIAGAHKNATAAFGEIAYQGMNCLLYTSRCV